MTATRTLAVVITLLAGLLTLTPFAARPAVAESAPTGMPDLVVGQQPLNDPQAVDVSIVNRGTAPAGSFKVSIQGGLINDEVLILSLAPGQRVNLSYHINAFGCATYTVTADFSNAVVESSERNNVFRESLCFGSF